MKTKKSIVSVLFLLITQLFFGQGIDFKNIPFEDALALAKTNDKLIFIDFHTEWCGPCKKLAKGPFKEQKNGEFYNKNFINLKLDAEKEGKDAAQRYQVNAFPTLMFVNGDGEIVHKGVGVENGYDMIGFGKEALNASNSKYSWLKLLEMFPARLDDQEFLKLYYVKWKNLELTQLKALDAWLKVQTEFDESSREMMEFLLSKQYSIFAGTKAEAIFNSNYDHFVSLATERQKTSLSRLKSSMILKSINAARKKQDPKLMRVVIDRLIENSDLKTPSGDNVHTLQMDYYRYSQDYTAFKRLAERYVDSLMRLHPISEIREKDVLYYTNYSKNKEFGMNKTTDIMLTKYKEGKIANELVDGIIETATYYFEYLADKKEAKTLNKWIEFCDKLIPEKYLVDNLKADILYRDGKIKKAIALKTRAVDNMPFTVKKKVNYQHELEVMKQSQRKTN